MKILLLPALCIGLLEFPARVDAGWNWANPLPDGESRGSVYFTDTATGYMAECCGRILKTIDGGKDWTLLRTGTTRFLSSIQFPSPMIGYAAGDSGTVLKTTNGGDSWTALTVPAGVFLYAAHFPDPLSGFVVGKGTLLRTRDGGATWDSSAVDTSAVLTSICFPEPDVGYAAGSGGLILKSIDSGRTWARQLVPSLKHLWSIRFLNRDTGFAGGDLGPLLATRNGGQRWTTVFNSESEIRSIQVSDARTVFAAGTGLKRSVNAGDSWSESGIPDTLESIYAMHFPAPAVGYATGYGGLIWKTMDGGITWSRLQRGNNKPVLRAIAFPTVDGGFAVGTGGSLFATTDKGRNWNYRSLDPNPDFYDIAFADPDTGYIAGGHAYRGGGVVFKTTDAGANWKPVSSGLGLTLRAIQFADARHGYAVGEGAPGGRETEGGGILGTADGGTTWDSIPLGLVPALFSVHFPRPDIGYAGGFRGAFFKTSDTGKHWSRIATDTTDSFESIWFLDAQTGIAASRNIRRTEDGGATWSKAFVPEGYSEIWHSVYFQDKDTGYAAGAGHYLRTVDGGRHWSAEVISGLDMFDLYFAHGDQGYAVGSSGAILYWGEDRYRTGIKGLYQHSLRNRSWISTGRFAPFDALGRRPAGKRLHHTMHWKSLAAP